MSDQGWRVEADEEWATAHSSTVMGWLRRRFRFLGGMANVVSRADTGPYAGAPRDPDLRPGDETEYSTVRYTTGNFAHTMTDAGAAGCRRCGRPVAEAHEIRYVGGDSANVPVGVVRTCRDCQAASWLLHSRMPAASRARRAARRHVL